MAGRLRDPACVGTELLASLDQIHTNGIVICQRVKLARQGTDLLEYVIDGGTHGYLRTARLDVDRVNPL